MHGKAEEKKSGRRAGKGRIRMEKSPHLNPVSQKSGFVPVNICI